jgi:hypothetical protein
VSGDADLVGLCGFGEREGGVDDDPQGGEPGTLYELRAGGAADFDAGVLSRSVAEQFDAGRCTER